MPKFARVIIIILIIGCFAGVYMTWRAIGYRANVNVYLEKYINHVRKLGDREQFAEADKSLVSDRIVPGRIVFFGSQAITNWDIKKSFPDYEAIGRGIDHQPTAGMLLRFRPDVIELHPQAVVIETASFNFRYPTHPKELFDHVMAMVDQAEQNGIIPLVMTTIPPLKDSSNLAKFEEETHGYQLIDSIQTFNDMIKTALAPRGLIIDAAADLSDSSGFFEPDYAADAINPSVSGYTRLAEMINRSLDTLVTDR